MHEEPSILVAATGHHWACLFTLQEPKLVPNCKIQGPSANGQFKKHLPVCQPRADTLCASPSLEGAKEMWLQEAALHLTLGITFPQPSQPR